MTAYFERLTAEAFQPTTGAQGAWSPDEIHFSPLGGLIVHAIDDHREADARADDGKALGRVSFDILGSLASDVCEIQVTTVRPGRTIELVEATVTIAGRVVVLARAWFIAANNTERVTGGEAAPLPPPEESRIWPLAETWPGGYVASLEMRAPVPPRPGQATAWLRTHTALIGGEVVSAHASFIALVDTANGIAVRTPPSEWMFPNLDLTIHLFRQPDARWVGLDTSVTFGPAGHGLTSTVLHDRFGSVGRAEQILTVRSRQP